MNTTPMVPSWENLGSWLRQHRDEWLRCSLERMRELPRDALLTREQLIDCLPLFLDGVCLRLEGGQAPMESANAARAHALQRHALGVPLDELVREYGLLLDCALGLCTAQARAFKLDAFRDLSARLLDAAAVAAAELVQREEARVRELERERTGFWAHEMRDPLASARMALELLKDDSTTKDEFLHALDTSLARASDRVDQMLSKLRVEALPCIAASSNEVLDIAALLDDVRADAEMHARRKGITLEIVVTPELHVAGDHRALLSALSNLARNAVKFTRRAGRVVICARLEEERVLIEVADECGGIPPEHVERLFEAFAQAGRDRSGFGLGLSIAQEAILAHGGTLMVRNQPGQGCMFIADLPARV